MKPGTRRRSVLVLLHAPERKEIQGRLRCAALHSAGQRGGLYGGSQMGNGGRVTELPDVLQFMQLLWAVVHGMERTSKRMTSEIGVTGPQRLVLRVVGLSPGLSAGDVAAILHVHPSTLTGVLHRLTSQGLITRTGDPRDRRRAILHLTPRGVRANAGRRGTVESAIAEALDGIGDRDRVATRRVLERLAHHLQGASDASPAAEQSRTSARAGRRQSGRRAARPVTAGPRVLPHQS